jgi:hypothetical protein
LQDQDPRLFKRGGVYQKNARDVEQKGHKGVGQKNHGPEAVNVVHCQAGKLDDGGEEAVGDCTGRGKVIERHQRVHLEVAGAQEALDQDKSQGLEDDAADLEHEAAEDKLDLTEGGDDHTEHDNGNVAEDFNVWRGDAECPCCKQRGNSRGGLGDTEDIIS